MSLLGGGRRLYPEPYRRLSEPGRPAPLRLAYGVAAAQHGELRLPDSCGPHPVVVLLHGGFWREVWRADLMNALARDLAARGLATWNLEYRRLGMRGGGWPGTLADVATGVGRLADLAAEQPIDAGRVALLGHSAGGQLALWAARQAAEEHGARPVLRPRAVVALAAVADLAEAARLGLGGGAAVELAGGMPEERPERYAAASPRALLPLGVPQLLVHGARDEAVPQAMSTAYAAAAAAAGDDVETLMLADEGHALLIDPARPHWPGVVAWMLARLR